MYVFYVDKERKKYSKVFSCEHLMICILHNRKGRFGRRVGQQVKVIKEFDLSNHDPGKIAITRMGKFKYLENSCKT